MKWRLYKFILAAASLSIFFIAQPIFAFDPTGEESRPYWIRIRDALAENNLDVAEALLNNPPITEKDPLMKADASLLYTAVQVLMYPGHDEADAKKILKMVHRALDLGLKVDAVFPEQLTADSKAGVLDATIHLWTQKLSEGKISETVLNDRITRFLDILFSRANEYCSNHTLTISSGDKSYQYKILRILLIQNLPLIIKNYFYKKIHFSVVQVEGLNFIQMLAYEGQLQELEYYVQLLRPEDARKAVNTVTQTSKPTSVLKMALMAIHIDVSVPTIKDVLKFLLDHGARNSLDLLDECDALAAGDPKNFAKFQELKVYLKELLKNYPAPSDSLDGDFCLSRLLPRFMKKQP